MLTGLEFGTENLLKQRCYDPHFEQELSSGASSVAPRLDSVSQNQFNTDCLLGHNIFTSWWLRPCTCSRLDELEQASADDVMAAFYACLLASLKYFTGKGSGWLVASLGYRIDFGMTQ